MKHAEHSGHKEKHYTHLISMGLLHFPIMYIVMFSMVYSAADIFHNLNTFYMAAMMVAPMLILMPLMMRKMYPNSKLNLIVYTASTVLFLALLFFTREQSFIGDRQFLRSMIPHHSGAILMCEKSKIEDAEIKMLCDEIIKGQRAEIEQMKKILDRM